MLFASYFLLFISLFFSRDLLTIVFHVTYFMSRHVFLVSSEVGQRDFNYQFHLERQRTKYRIRRQKDKR